MQRAAGKAERTKVDSLQVIFFSKRCANEKRYCLLTWLPPRDAIDTYRIDEIHEGTLNRALWHDPRFSGHHRGDELMLMSEHADSSKLINAS